MKLVMIRSRISFWRLSFLFGLMIGIRAIAVEQQNWYVAKATEIPIIDGKITDEVWSYAPTLIVSIQKSMGKDKGKETTKLRLQAVYTDTELAILAIWADETEDRTYKTWIWDSAKSRYKKGRDLEDIFSVGFPIRGPFTGDMLSPIEVEWDVWHWNAARTDPSGYAFDRRHVHTFAQPKGKAKQISIPGGKKIWFANPADQGYPLFSSRPKPRTFEGQSVPSFVVNLPTHSQADVQAKGIWESGRWQLELRRKLDTGHSDDLAFTPSQIYPVAIAIFDHSEGGRHGSSSVVKMNFRQ